MKSASANCLSSAIFALFLSPAQSETVPVLELDLTVSDQGEIMFTRSDHSSSSIDDLDLSAVIAAANQGGAGSGGPTVGISDDYLKFFDESYTAYKFSNRDGSDAFVWLPEDQGPLAWAKPDTTVGIAPIDPSAGGGLAAWFRKRDPQVVAGEAIRYLTTAAIEQYCNTTARPTEFEIEIEIGAELVVSGKAKVKAKFLTKEICQV